MNVRLTLPQWNAVRTRLSPDLVEAMKEWRKPAGKSVHDYRLPAIGWRRALDELLACSYGPIGGATKGPDSLYNAISRIAKAVDILENHPALVRGAAVMGVSNEIIPAWVNGFNMSPYPRRNDGGFGLLVPRHEITGSRSFTFWRWRPAGLPSQAEDVLHQEIVHLRLGGRVDLARVPELD